MEPRLVLSVQPVVVGSVFVEEDLGSDAHGDSFYVAFQGGAPGTQLNSISFNGDQNGVGFNVGDVFFDTNSQNSEPEEGRFGADESFDFQIVSQTGIDEIKAFVDDGTSMLRLEFVGFDVGDQFVFAIDVDEVEDFDPQETDIQTINDGFDPITSGVEFQGSTFTADFSAPHFEDLKVVARFVNRYDDLLVDNDLDLPSDNDDGKRDRTAGAVAKEKQIVIPGSLSGQVYHDANQNGRRDPDESGLAGVAIQAIPIETVVDQTIQTALTDDTGKYRFDDLMPGRYRLVELEQPEGYFDWLESVGTVNGSPSGRAVNPGDLIDDIELPGGGRGVDYDFGEILPVSIRGNVHLSTADGDCFGENTLHDPIANVQIQLLNESGEQVARTTTDAQGRYEFLNLYPDTYTLIEMTPDGLFDGGAQAGRVNGQPDQGARVVDAGTVETIQLASGQLAEEFDFCEYEPARISGFVFHDQDDNGTKDPDEQGISDVIVQLVNEQGVVAATLTGPNGAYQFSDVTAGNYQLVELQPDDWLDGQDRAGLIDGQRVGRAINPGDQIEQITLGWGEQGQDYDFGELLATDISGRVHLSTTDGECFSTDVLHQPVGGVVVELLDADGQVVRETLTDAEGRYEFRELAPGRYGIRELTPSHLIDGGATAGTINDRDAGVVLDSNTVLEIDLRSGEQARNVDFCEREPALLSGAVYHDRNDDGRQQSSEEGIAGVTLVLLDGGGLEIRRVQTNDDGVYQFDRLRRGVYRIVEIQPDGWDDGLDASGIVDGVPQGNAVNPGDEIRNVSLGWGQRGTDYQFGELRLSSVAGRVHADLNDDCELQENERPLEGVRIQLIDGDGVVVANQQTNQRGEFRFDSLRPGVYTVRQTQPADYFTAGQEAGSGGGDDEVDNVISRISVQSGVDLVNYRFCEEPPSEISGFVFQDGPTIELQPGESLSPNLSEIRDGRLTPDDQRLGSVVLELRDGLRGTQIDASFALPGYYGSGPIRTTTDENGFYQFTGLAARSYAIYEIQPAGFLDGIDSGGSVPAIAINRHEVDEIDPQVMSSLKHDPNFDAIVRLGLFPAVVSTDNNFSEIRVEQNIILPSEVPASAPVPPPIEIRWEPFTSVYRPIEMLPYQLTPYGRLRGVTGSTWHLSVLDGGTPRGQGVTVDERGPVWFVKNEEYRISWNNASAQQMHWVMVIDGQIQREQIFGVGRGTPFAGDFNGDGLAEIGVFYEGQWFVDLNGNGRWDEDDLWARLGHRGNQPVVGDWDGDGKDDIGVFGLAWAGDPQAVKREPGLPDRENRKPGRYKNVPPRENEATQGRRDIRLHADGRTRSDVIDHVFHFGVTGDRAVAGDWNGDGIGNIGVFDNGVWHLDNDGDGEFTSNDRTFTFGKKGDLPITGDFNGDGIDEVGILSNGRLVLDVNRNFRVDDGDQTIVVDRRPGRPVVGDWNGDGVDDIAMTYEELRFVEVDARR